MFKLPCLKTAGSFLSKVAWTNRWINKSLQRRWINKSLQRRWINKSLQSKRNKLDRGFSSYWKEKQKRENSCGYHGTTSKQPIRFELPNSQFSTLVVTWLGTVQERRHYKDIICLNFLDEAWSAIFCQWFSGLLSSSLLLLVETQRFGNSIF